MILKFGNAGVNKFSENGRRIIRSLYKESCRIAASAPHVMWNQNMTNVRETTTLIRSNAVNIIDQDEHLILLSWIIVSLGDEQSERTRQWSKWPVWVNKHSEWPRPTKRKQLGWIVRTFPFFLWQDVIWNLTSIQVCLHTCNDGDHPSSFTYGTNVVV